MNSRHGSVEGVMGDHDPCSDSCALLLAGTPELYFGVVHEVIGELVSKLKVDLIVISMCGQTARIIPHMRYSIL